MAQDSFIELNQTAITTGDGRLSETKSLVDKRGRSSSKYQDDRTAGYQSSRGAEVQDSDR